MVEEQPAVRSRRSVLAGLLGGIGVAIASGLGRERVAQAADGDPLILGTSNQASSRTTVTTGVSGTGDSSLEVLSTGQSATAIHAQAPGIGLRAEGSTGVVGSSNSTSGPGVLGEDSTLSVIGRGVQGNSHNGWGVYASSDGQALRVDGRATFSRSGTAVISSPNASVTIPVSGALSQSTSFPERPSFALATLQTDAPDVWVRAAVLDHSAGTLTIHLNKPPAKKNEGPVSVTLGWMVVN